MDDDTHRRLCAARRRLATDEDVGIRELSRASGFSTRHFVRTFKALFGQTPHAYRIRARTERARVALSATEKGVTQIALETGHGSAAHFSDAFRRIVGETPSSFRRRASGTNSPAAEHELSAFPGCLTLLSHLPTSG